MGFSPPRLRARGPLSGSNVSARGRATHCLAYFPCHWLRKPGTVMAPPSRTSSESTGPSAARSRPPDAGYATLPRFSRGQTTLLKNDVRQARPPGSRDRRLHPGGHLVPSRGLAVDWSTGCLRVHSGSGRFLGGNVSQAGGGPPEEVRHVAVVSARRMCVAA